MIEGYVPARWVANCKVISTSSVFLFFVIFTLILTRARIFFCSAMKSYFSLRWQFCIDSTRTFDRFPFFTRGNLTFSSWIILYKQCWKTIKGAQTSILVEIICSFCKMESVRKMFKLTFLDAFLIATFSSLSGTRLFRLLDAVGSSPNSAASKLSLGFFWIGRFILLFVSWYLLTTLELYPFIFLAFEGSLAFVS